jgi:hypothetical protein
MYPGAASAAAAARPDTTTLDIDTQPAGDSAGDSVLARQTPVGSNLTGSILIEGSSEAVAPAAVCTTPCTATTLPAGCSVTGSGTTRHQAPSCKCYDTPLFMSGAPPPLDVNSTGQWVQRGSSSTPAPRINGINWFGFNNGQTMVDGLWASYQNVSVGDFPTV